MFTVKKLISAFLMPMPLCLGVLAAGLILLWFTRRQKAARLLLTAGVALLVLVISTGAARLLVHPLEGYPPLLPPGGNSLDARALSSRWIVVLGGWHAETTGLPPTSQLGTTLARLVEAVRLKHRIPGARLVLSGGFGSGGVTHADVLAGAAEILGVPRTDMVLE